MKQALIPLKAASNILMRHSLFKNTLFLFLITLLIYMLSYRGEGADLNYFILLADAFLHSRLYLLDNPPHLNELINLHGRYFVVYPPMPAILLMPFVAIFGTSFPQPYLSILLSAINVSLSYLVFLKVFGKKSIAFWLSLLFAFGTMQWYHAEVGSAWYVAHIVALFFLWLLLLEILTKQRLFLIGLLIGGAYLSRLPAILSIVFVLIYLHQRFFDPAHKKLGLRNLFLLGLGLTPAILLNWGYNFLRFGVIHDSAYTLLPIFDEPWYKYGLFSINNIPVHLIEVFFAPPIFRSTPPYIIPSLSVMSLLFITPAFFLIIFSKFRQKLMLSSVIIILIMALPGLMHGSSGFTQFGFRFALDYLPFLLILTGSGLQNKFSWWAKVLIILSILVNLWGVYMITHLQIWTM